MKSVIGIAASLLLVTALALGCSREEASQTVEQAKEAATEAAEAGREAAGDVAAAARETAEAAGEAMEEAEESAREAAEGMAGAMDDPVQTCREFAAKGAWDQALEACTKAHEAQPDDMAIEHALQQAQAAAAP